MRCMFVDVVERRPVAERRNDPPTWIDDRIGSSDGNCGREQRLSDRQDRVKLLDIGHSTDRTLATRCVVTALRNLTTVRRP